MARISLCFVLFLCGCFRELDAVRYGPATLPSIHLEVRDHSGAVWPATDCPRMATFVLHFAKSAPGDAVRHLFLLRAAPSEQTLTDLASGKLNARSEAQRLPLTLHAQGAALQATSERPLEPAAHYTLVWAEAHGAVQLPITVSASPAAGAQLVQSLPAALDARVPPNLTRILLRFDGYVRGDAPGLVRLLDDAGNDLAGPAVHSPCSAFGLGPGDCIGITLDHELAPRQRHHLTMAEGLSDATMTPLPALDIPFTTSAERDLLAPRLLPLDCAKDEARHGSVCVLSSDDHLTLRARSDENGILELAIAPGVYAALASAGEYTLSSPLLAPTRALLVLGDMAGNRTQLELQVAPARDLAQVSIEEVRVDPLGPEPAQEYVELLNFGEQPVSIMGFTLTDDPYAEGQRIADERELAPGERVLAVAPDFDVRDETDGEPASGAHYVRLSGPLSLRNDGAALLLRDASGRRLSASPALAPGQAGQCIVRSGLDHRAPLGFVQERSGGCTPGFGSDDG